MGLCWEAQPLNFLEKVMQTTEDYVLSGQWIVPCGKFAGKRLNEISLKQLDSYIGYLESVTVSWKMRETMDCMVKYLKQPHIQRELEEELEQ